MSDKNELMTTGSGFLALADFNMNESMAEELEGLEGGFDRVKIPSGGATMFELPGDEADEPEMVKEFSAVILHHHPVLQYRPETPDRLRLCVQRNRADTGRAGKIPDRIK